MQTTHVRVAIIGAGFGGLGAAIRLAQRGIDDYLVFEKADDVGGTWRDNTYPGCVCDVPSHLYSYSFALNPTWSRSFSPQPEIWAYLQRCAARYGVTPRIRFRHEVHDAHWAGGQWHLVTSGGGYTADLLVTASGPLSEPSIPDLPGLASFAGKVFHSARWDHTYDLSGKRVAVVGTGASAIQIVPEIAPRVAHLTVLQRTAPWILPRRDRTLRRFEHAMFRYVPGAQRLVRWSIYWAREWFAMGFLHPPMMSAARHIARRHLERSIVDPGLRERMSPRYTLGCKRVLLSNDYLPALTRDNVKLVTSGIDHITPQGILTDDGELHEIDAIVLGTGFHVTDMPIARHVRGADGRTLAEVWQGSPRAYLGTSVAGFPNLFLLLGPNTGLGHTSVIIMIEAQIRYLIRLLGFLDRRGAAAVEPRDDVQERFVAHVDRRMRDTVWLTGGCASWYLDPTGRNSTLWPGFTLGYRNQLRRFRPEHHVVHLSAPAPIASEAAA